MFYDIINYQKDNIYKSFCFDDSFPDTLYTVGMIDDFRNDLTLKWNEIYWLYAQAFFIECYEAYDKLEKLDKNIISLNESGFLFTKYQRMLLTPRCIAYDDFVSSIPIVAFIIAEDEKEYQKIEDWCVSKGFYLTWWSFTMRPAFKHLKRQLSKKLTEKT